MYEKGQTDGRTYRACESHLLQGCEGGTVEVHNCLGDDRGLALGLTAVG